MRILIIGGNGQLGRDMYISCRQAGHDTWRVDIPEIDITKEESVSRTIGRMKPDAVVNCAAFTDVDACEEKRGLALAVNGTGVGYIGKTMHELNSRVVHISTDFVFDGTKKTPYVETDQAFPKSEYGKSKLVGEEQLLRSNPRSTILRVAWLYGNRGNNFVKAIRRIALQKARTNEILQVVNDQIGTPTYTMDVCKQTLRLLDGDYYGVYHCTNEGQCTKYEFAKHILDLSGISIKIEPCTTDSFPSPAARPHYSVLENRRLKEAGIHCMRDWENAFSSFLQEEKSLSVNPSQEMVKSTIEEGDE